MITTQFTIIFKMLINVKNSRIVLLVVCLVFFFHYAQAGNPTLHVNELPADTTAPKTLFASSYNSTINPFYRGVVILNGKLMEEGILSIETLPVDSIASIAIIRKPSPRHIQRYGPSATNGVIMIDTKKKFPDSIWLNYLLNPK